MDSVLSKDAPSKNDAQQKEQSALWTPYYGATMFWIVPKRHMVAWYQVHILVHAAEIFSLNKPLRKKLLAHGDGLLEKSSKIIKAWVWNEEIQKEMHITKKCATEDGGKETALYLTKFFWNMEFIHYTFWQNGLLLSRSIL